MKKVLLITMLFLVILVSPVSASDITYTDLKIKSGQDIPLQLNSMVTYSIGNVAGGDNITAIIYNDEQPVIVIHNGTIIYAEIFTPGNCYITLSSTKSTNFEINIELLPYEREEKLVINPKALDLEIGDSIDMTATLNGQSVEADYTVPDFVSNNNGSITAIEEGEGYIQASYYVWEENTLVSYVSMVFVVVRQATVAL